MLLSTYREFVKIQWFCLEIEFSGAIAIYPSGVIGDFRGAIDDRSIIDLFEGKLAY